MVTVIAYTLASVIVVSLISVVGILSLFSKRVETEEILLLLVSLSAGTLFGSAFLHLLPETVEQHGLTIRVSLLVIAGILAFFVLEKIVHWRHCHLQRQSEQKIQQLAHHPTQLAPLNLAGDALHNFMDGLAIAGSYLISIPTGIATTIAVVLHEIPQEVADFGVLLYAGLSKWKALLYNFFSATTAIVGAAIGLMLGARSGIFTEFILPFTAGGFVYIAGSNLIPELHKGCNLKDSFWHFVAMVLGIALMGALVMIE